MIIFDSPMRITFKLPNLFAVGKTKVLTEIKDDQ